MEAVTNVCALTEHGFRSGQTVTIEQGRICAIMDDGDFGGETSETRDAKGAYLLPGFIDIQVNGGNGVLFNEAPTSNTIRRIGQAHRRFGTTGFLPTLFSDDLDKVEAAIDATREAVEAGVPGVLGIHLEGPFLNKTRKGIHDASKFRVLNDKAVALLASLGVGKTLVTLAPETTSPAMIRELVEAGVIVSAGHTDASYKEATDAIAAGIRGFTHLFNAMSPLTSRKPGAVGAALDSADCWCGVIVDGHHVHEATLRIALAAKGTGRLLLVTDAMATVGTSEKTFVLGGQPIRAVDGACMSPDGTLAGSDLDMATAVRNTVSMLGLDLAEAVRMASLYPARFLGVDHELGCIKPGHRANLVLADRDLDVIDTWIDGNSIA